MKKVILPQREEMLRRLLTVSDESHFQERFYPLLLKYAGRTLLPHGILMMLALSIDDYCRGMPPVMISIMYMTAPKIVDALIDNHEVAKEVNNLLAQAT